MLAALLADANNLVCNGPNMLNLISLERHGQRRPWPTWC
jgi:hypothetical protein